MAEDRIDRAFEVLDRPLEPDPTFRRQLFERLLRESKRRPSLLPPPRGVRRRRPGLNRVVTIAAGLGLAAAVFAIALLPLLNLGRDATPGVVGPFAEMPPFRATIRLVVPPSALPPPEGPPSEGPRAGTSELLVSYGGPEAWRYELVSGGVTGVIPPDPGSYAVWDGRRLRFYSAADDTYSLQRVSEPHDTFSILNVLAWDGPGEGRWAGSCAEGQEVGRETVAGRAALHVACPEAGPLGAPVDLWVDVETGLVLKIDATAAPGASLPFRSPFGPAPGGTLEVIDVEYRPAFADDEPTFVPPEGSEPAGEVSPGPATGLAIGEGVPTWVLPALGGGTIDLASLRGEPTLVYVWATWCPPCADGEVSGAADPLAVFDDAWLQHGASVTFVAVAHRDDEPIVARFVDQRGYSVPIALDTSGEALAAWGVEGIPLLVVLDAEGALAGAYLGDLRGPDVRAIVEAVTAGDPLPSVGGKTVEQLPS